MKRFTKRIKFKVWSLVLAFCLVWSPPAQAQVVMNVNQQRSETLEQLLQTLAKARVVYLGEIHDRAEDHQIQLVIIQALHQANPKLVIGMEMFQKPCQSVLDRYLAGEISEAELREQSEYDTRWGHPWEYYAPILRFARDQGLPVVALNTPTEVTRQVARNGLESLTPADQRWIPPLAEIRTDNSEYRQWVQEVYLGIAQHQMSSRGFDRFFQAQVLWDETMAEGITQIVKQKPDRQIIVLAGQMHIAYGYGIPDRVARRMGVRLIQQRLVLINPPEESRQSSSRSIADYLWISD
ncbi:MAG: ChaN family lipoprotein [Leptolyngbyaceae cyanobacterium bins.59]|nr:ChaN family lipoprotein [Leptolyngbyaceae cyanobacterium bins.59]